MSGEPRKTTKARRERAGPLAFPVAGWSHANLDGFDRLALAEQGARSLVELGFERLSLVESYHSDSDRRDGRSNEFSLWEHPQGIIASMDTTTGGFKSGGFGLNLENYDPTLRQVNSIYWTFQLEAGCGEHAVQGLGMVGGSGGAWVGADGSWAEKRSCSMQGGAAGVLRAIQSTGRLIAFNEWAKPGGLGGLSLPSQLWLGLDGGAGVNEALNAPRGSVGLFEAWLSTLPERTRAGIEAARSKSESAGARINDVGPYLSRCVGAAGRRWTTEAERRLHTVWSDWISDADGVEAIPQDAPEAFKVSECGATILQCLLSDCQNERSERLALSFIQAAPLSKLSKVANALDGRGASAGMRCFEVCASGAGKETAWGAQRVFEALAARLGPRLRMSGPSASALGLLFSQADRPRRRDVVFMPSDALEALFICAERHGAPWTAGGLRCPYPEMKGERRDPVFPWGAARLSKSMPALARHLGKMGCHAAAALAEAKELSSCVGVKTTTRRKAPLSL